MKSRRLLLLISTLVITLVALVMVVARASASPNADTRGSETVYDAASAFEALKSFEGEWKSTPVGGDESRASTVVYKVSANGSSVIKTYGPGTKYEMFSVFHMDGDELLMTHYCAVGNQPKMRFRPSDKPGEIYFEFAGGTNFDPAKDGHAHEGSTQVTGTDTQESMAISHREGEAQPPRYSKLVRVD
ncbi:MAG: hypothetical protein AAGA81_02040 [Acidobacteriota bacterium]